MTGESNPLSKGAGSAGFWSGYVLWLRGKRRRLVVLTLLLIALFLFGVWISGTPDDPFVYDDIY